MHFWAKMEILQEEASLKLQTDVDTRRTRVVFLEAC